MRKLFLSLLIFFPSLSFAQTQLGIWSIENVDFQNASRIELELETGKKYFFAYGLIVSSDNTAFSAHGACYTVVSGNAVCELDARGTIWIMTLGPTLSGTVSVRNGSDSVIDEGSVIFQSVE